MTDTNNTITPPPVTDPVQPVAAPAAEAVPAPQPPPSDLIDIDQFFKIKLRVAQVVSAEKVEKSKKLLKLQVDLGPELGQRQILSGISQFYTPEQLVGRKIIVVANLKPAKLMGLESQGMLLAASTADHGALTIVAPSEDIPIGSAVS